MLDWSAAGFEGSNRRFPSSFMERALFREKRSCVFCPFVKERNKQLYSGLAAHSISLYCYTFTPHSGVIEYFWSVNNEHANNFSNSNNIKSIKCVFISSVSWNNLKIRQTKSRLNVWACVYVLFCDTWNVLKIRNGLGFGWSRNS